MPIKKIAGVGLGPVSILVGVILSSCQQVFARARVHLLARQKLCQQFVSGFGVAPGMAVAAPLQMQEVIDLFHFRLGRLLIVVVWAVIPAGPNRWRINV